MNTEEKMTEEIFKDELLSKIFHILPHDTTKAMIQDVIDQSMYMANEYKRNGISNGYEMIWQYSNKLWCYSHFLTWLMDQDYKQEYISSHNYDYVSTYLEDDEPTFHTDHPIKKHEYTVATMQNMTEVSKLCHMCVDKKKNTDKALEPEKPTQQE